MRAYRLGKVASFVALLTAAAVSGGPAEAEDKPVQAEISATTSPTLTVQQQLGHAEAASRRAGQLAERLSRMLDEARREKDIMRANCVNRKLTEVNANARNIEQRHKALRDAAGINDQSRINHEYTVITVLGQKLDSLNNEAALCLGQSVYEPGASQVVTTVPNNVIVGIDPATVPTPPPPPPAVNVPPQMSPAT